MNTLRDKLIRLAYTNPGPVRDTILPILKQSNRPLDKRVLKEIKAAAQWVRMKYRKEVWLQLRIAEMGFGDIYDTSEPGYPQATDRYKVETDHGEVYFDKLTEAKKFLWDQAIKQMIKDGFIVNGEMLPLNEWR